MNEKCINSIWLTKSRRGFKIKRTNAWSKTWFEFYWTKKTGKISGTLRKSLSGSARALTGLVVKYIKIRADGLRALRVSEEIVTHLILSCENLSLKVWRANETFAFSAVCKCQERSLALVVGGKSLITADLTQNKGIHLYLEEKRGRICECQCMITNAASNAPGIIQGRLSHWKSDVKRRVQCSVLFVAHCHVNYLQLLKPPLEHSLNNIPHTFWHVLSSYFPAK